MSQNKSFSTETSERYAKAIFELAQESSSLEKLENNVQVLLKVCETCKDFELFIKDPTISFETQKEIIKKMSQLMNFTKQFEDFLLVLSINKRIFFLKQIMISFLRLSSEKKGELKARLISSKNLTEKEVKDISVELSKSIGSKIKFQLSVDKDLIGGFKMQLGSLMIDTSIKNRLKKYEKLMLRN